MSSVLSWVVLETSSFTRQRCPHIICYRVALWEILSRAWRAKGVQQWLSQSSFYVQTFSQDEDHIRWKVMRSQRDSKGFILWGSWMLVQKFHSNLYDYWVEQQEGSVLTSTGLCPVCRVSLCLIGFPVDAKVLSHSMRRVCLFVFTSGGKNPLIPNMGILIGDPKTRVHKVCIPILKIAGWYTVCVYCLSWLALFLWWPWGSRHDNILQNLMIFHKTK